MSRWVTSVQNPRRAASRLERCFGRSDRRANAEVHGILFVRLRLGVTRPIQSQGQPSCQEGESLGKSMIVILFRCGFLAPPPGPCGTSGFRRGTNSRRISPGSRPRAWGTTASSGSRSRLWMDADRGDLRQLVDGSAARSSGLTDPTIGRHDDARDLALTGTWSAGMARFSTQADERK